jgi:hypothetical protein
MLLTRSGVQELIMAGQPPDETIPVQEAFDLLARRQRAEMERLDQAMIAIDELRARVSAFEHLLIVVFSILRQERTDVEGLLEKVRERAGESNLSRKHSWFSAASSTSVSRPIARPEPVVRASPVSKAGTATISPTAHAQFPLSLNRSLL